MNPDQNVFTRQFCTMTQPEQGPCNCDRGAGLPKSLPAEEALPASKEVSKARELCLPRSDQAKQNPPFALASRSADADSRLSGQPRPCRRRDLARVTPRSKEVTMPVNVRDVMQLLCHVSEEREMKAAFKHSDEAPWWWEQRLSSEV
ncbi:hypothetical protein E2320_001194 [Naja naja]|nr:hypothetical protein E2320_001194 [Naja naja]